MCKQITYIFYCIDPGDQEDLPHKITHVYRHPCNIKRCPKAPKGSHRSNPKPEEHEEQVKGWGTCPTCNTTIWKENVRHLPNGSVIYIGERSTPQVPAEPYVKKAGERSTYTTIGAGNPHGLSVPAPTVSGDYPEGCSEISDWPRTDREDSQPLSKFQSPLGSPPSLKPSSAYGGSSGVSSMEQSPNRPQSQGPRPGSFHRAASSVAGPPRSNTAPVSTTSQSQQNRGRSATRKATRKATDPIAIANAAVAEALANPVRKFARPDHDMEGWQEKGRAPKNGKPSSNEGRLPYGSTPQGYPEGVPGYASRYAKSSSDDSSQRGKDYAEKKKRQQK